MPSALERQGRKYLFFRLLIVLAGIVLVTFYQMSLGPAFGEHTFLFLYGLLGAYLVISVTLLFTHSRWKHVRHAMRWQVVGDFVLQSLLIWGTGGVLSIFSPLLFVTLVAATSVISARGALILATIATAFLIATTLASVVGVAPFGDTSPSPWISRGKNAVFIGSCLLGNVLALYTISALGSRFSQGLRSVQGLQSEILENMAEGLIAVDRSGNVVHVNNEARRLLGLDESRLRSTRLSLDSLFPAATHAVLREAFAQSKRRRFETTIEGPEGRGKPIEVKVSVARDEFGEPRYQIGLLSDLTLKHEVEAAERRIQKLEDVHVMALGIAHEIRNPLASIQGCVQEIRRLCQDSPGLGAFVNIVCRESQRLDGILEEFLRYARSGPVDLIPLDLVEVLNEALLLLRTRPDVGSRRIMFAPPSSSPRVFGDRNGLIQVFLNLGINALEATDPGTGEIVFCLRNREFAQLRDGKTSREYVPGVEVEVRDNGNGLNDTESGRLFTPFFTTKVRGTGLGLSIVERIVREHLGVVGFCRSEEGGSLFRVWFPSLGREDDGSRVRIADGHEVTEAAEQACHV